MLYVWDECLQLKGGVQDFFPICDDFPLQKFKQCKTYWVLELSQLEFQGQGKPTPRLLPSSPWVKLPRHVRILI